MEELINTEDEDTEDFNKFVEMRNIFINLKSDIEKMNYLNKMYKEDYYYPPDLNKRLLFNQFEDRIV